MARVLLGLLPIVLTVLFIGEGLFLDRSLLGIDNRYFGPFFNNVGPEEVDPRPMNFVTSDINGWIMPETMVQLQRLENGEVPLWNPHMNAGQPLLANLGFSPFYPTSILYFVLSPLRAYAVSMALHLCVLGFGTLVFLKTLRLSPWARGMGLVVAMLSGFVVAHLHLPHFIRTVAWFPWLLVLAGELARHPRARAMAGFALATGLSFLAGFPQLALINAYVVVAWYVYRWFVDGRGSRVRSLIQVCLAAVIGGMIACVQMLPAVELLGQSWRQSGLDEEQARRKSLEPELLVGYLSPRFFGSPVLEAVPGQPPSPPQTLETFPTYEKFLDGDIQNNFVENTLYVGLIPLALGLLAIFICRSGRTFFFFALTVVSLAVVTGAPGFFEVSRVLPGFSTGSPKRILFLPAFGMAVLVALAVDRSLEKEEPRRGFWWLGGGLFALLGAGWFLPFESWWPGIQEDVATWWRRTWVPDAVTLGVSGVTMLLIAALRPRMSKAVVGLLILTVTVFDLLWLGRDTNPTQPLHGQYDSTPLIRFLQSEVEGGDVRLLTWDSDRLFSPTFSQIFGISSLNGTAALVDRETGELLRAVDEGMLNPLDPRVVTTIKSEERLMHPLLDRLGVTHVIVNRPLAPETAGHEVAYQNEAQNLGVYRRTKALPRVHFVAGCRVIADREERLAYLASGVYDPTKEAILEVQDDFPLESLTPGKVKSVQRPKSERVDIEVEVDGPAFLVFAESAAPGWFAQVDGERVEIRRVDHALMGIPLPKGAQRVVFEYRPLSFSVGALATLCGLGTTLVLAARRRRPLLLDRDEKAST